MFLAYFTLRYYQENAAGTRGETAKSKTCFLTDPTIVTRIHFMAIGLFQLTEPHFAQALGFAGRYDVH
jgi:hypothetical protein